MLAHQVLLRNSAGHTMTVWVDARLEIAKGNEVVGKDGLTWSVVASYRQVLVETTHLPHGWHVGGLM